MCPAISLDKREKNSNGSTVRELCPRSTRYIEYTDGQIIKRKPLECNRLDCPVCGPRRLKSEREKYYGMAKSYIDAMASKYPKAYKRDGKYWVKLLTLTCPGKEYRRSGNEKGSVGYSGRVHPVEAYKEMQGNWNRLNTLLRKHFPRMTTIRVYEPQRDGYPHFHVLLIGPDANKRGLLEFIREYWVGVYSMGNVDIQWMKRGLGGGLNYVIKYLTKLTRGLVHLPKGARVINAAHRLYEWFKKRKTIFRVTRMGNYDREEGYGSPFWEFRDESGDVPVKPGNVSDEGALLLMDKEEIERNLEELLNYFGSAIPTKKPTPILGTQQTLNFGWSN